MFVFGLGVAAADDEIAIGERVGIRIGHRGALTDVCFSNRPFGLAHASFVNLKCSNAA
jgi:hypothetical protein